MSQANWSVILTTQDLTGGSGSSLFNFKANYLNEWFPVNNQQNLRSLVKASP